MILYSLMWKYFEKHIVLITIFIEFLLNFNLY